ncbi:MAG: hypothetical protein IJJ78_00460 [Paludibacteraceae bacterium]|nr:hypothetical protein [Paludibacteraceae bacterium]
MKVFYKITLALLMAIAPLAASAYTFEDFDSRPIGFAGLTGTYAMPICNNGTWEAPAGYTLVTVNNSTDLASAIGNNKIILVEAGTYASKVTIDGKTNLTILGLGGVKFTGGFTIKGSSSNILCRNFSVMEYTGDGFDITGAATNIWLDHLTIGWATTSSNKEKPDGAMDFTSNSGTVYITLSWCKVMNTWKTSLLGSGDSDGASTSGPRHVTYYCDYFYNTDQRTPRIRGGETHVLNCLYENCGWERPVSLTASEHEWAEKGHIEVDREYHADHLLNCVGYGIMAAKQANLNVDSCFFLDVMWPILVSRPYDIFREKFGDLQSADINNGGNTSTLGDGTVISHSKRNAAGNGGCYAVRQRGNGYSDLGLSDKIKVKTYPIDYDATTNPAIYVPLDYTMTYYGVEHTVIKPEMLNPGKRSIKFDDYNASNAWDPASIAGYYPADYTPRTSDEVRSFVAAYAGADTYSMTCSSTPIAAPTLTYTGDLTQSNFTTISPIVFTWGGGAEDVVVTGIPAANMTKNMGAKTLTISGTTEGLLDYTITTTGGSGAGVSYSGTLTPKAWSAFSCPAMVNVEITLVAAGSYELAIYNGGTKVKTIYNGAWGAGKSSIMFSVGDLDSGSYTYKLTNGSGDVVNSQTGSVDVP